MKRQTEKSQILGTYVLLAQELGCIYPRNREKSSIIELDKEILFDMRERILTKFIISSLEKFTRPKMLIQTKDYYTTNRKQIYGSLQTRNGRIQMIFYLLTPQNLMKNSLKVSQHQPLSLKKKMLIDHSQIQGEIMLDLQQIMAIIAILSQHLHHYLTKLNLYLNGQYVTAPNKFYTLTR